MNFTYPPHSKQPSKQMSKQKKKIEPNLCYSFAQAHLLSTWGVVAATIGLCIHRLIVSNFSYSLICWCMVILFSMRFQSVVLCSTFVCGFCDQHLCVVVCERERERHHHKPMASTAKTNGPTTERQTQTHNSITKHIKLNIKHHHNLQTQKPIYPKIKQMGLQVKLEEERC